MMKTTTLSKGCQATLSQGSRGLGHGFEKGGTSRVYERSEVGASEEGPIEDGYKGFVLRGDSLGGYINQCSVEIDSSESPKEVGEAVRGDHLFSEKDSIGDNSSVVSESEQAGSDDVIEGPFTWGQMLHLI